MSDQGKYGYAVARVRAMERRLLDAPVIQRLLDAEDAASVIKILGETSYASTIAANAGETDFDKILESELKSTYDEFVSFVPDKAIVDIMLLQYDFHNVKVLLKSYFNVKSGGKKRWDLLTSLGAYPSEGLITHVELEEYNYLPFGLKELVPHCIAILEQSGDAVEVERLLDKRMYELMLEEAKLLDMPGLTGWVRTRIDGENIRTLVRLKRFGYDGQGCIPFLHLGGAIPVTDLAVLANEPFESAVRALQYGEYGKFLSQIEFSGDFSELIMQLEKALDDLYLERLSVFRYSSSAPENITWYLWAKEMEIKNVRMILVSKGGKSDNESLRGLLRNG